MVPKTSGKESSGLNDGQLTYEKVTGGGVAFPGGQGLTGHTAAATAVSGGARVIGIDCYTACDFTGVGQYGFGGYPGLAVSGQGLRIHHFFPVDLNNGRFDDRFRSQRLTRTANALDFQPR